MIDTLLVLAAEGDKPNPLPHVLNHPWWYVGDYMVWSAIQTNLVISALIMLVLGPWIAKSIATGPESEGHDRYVTKNVFAHMIEVICVYLRDVIVEPLLHERTARFMPFLWTLFFFILINNLMGLIPILDIVTIFAFDMVHHEHRAPIGGTATQNLWVTGTLAAIAGLLINIEGLRELGPKEFVKHMTGGIPLKPAYLPVVAIVFVIEVAGIFIKPIALAIRLFANMTAGHTLLATLGMFVAMAFGARTLLVTAPVTLLSAAGMIGILCLELFVAFLQAFVFMFLTAVFISLLSHHGEHEDHAHEPAHA
ncbi:MAG: ATP synthase F0 subunit A [Planctomycetota bacterium]|nr:MAG: ATP synthase F0 subunit A [Planctomycetota bacterium]